VRLARQHAVRANAADRVGQVERRSADVARHGDDSRELPRERVLCSSRACEHESGGGGDETSAKQDHDRRSPVADFTGIYIVNHPGSRTLVTDVGGFVTAIVPHARLPRRIVPAPLHTRLFVRVS
jgi:hypothetical protein